MDEDHEDCETCRMMDEVGRKLQQATLESFRDGKVCETDDRLDDLLRFEPKFKA